MASVENDAWPAGREDTAGDGAVLEVAGLHVAFRRGRDEVTVIDGVDLRIGPGKMLGLVGESGSGKSVTARAVMRLLPASARVWGRQMDFQGRELLTLTQRQMRKVRGAGIAMVFQDPLRALNPTMTVGKQVAESLRTARTLDKAALRRQGEDLLGSLGISDPKRRLDQYPHELSGGMRQRVMIAIAVAGEPKLLIADEPTTALDVTRQVEVMELLARVMAERNLAVLFITHDLRLAGGWCDELAVMYAGRVVERVPARHLAQGVAMPYTDGLLSSIPDLTTPVHSMIHVIEGRPPTPGNWPAGCRFHLRCPYVQPRCTSEIPALEHLGEDHEVACWHPLRQGGND